MARFGPPWEASPRGARPRVWHVPRRGHRVVATRVVVLWRGQCHRSGGPSAVRSWARAPQLSGECAGQGERRQGSTRAVIDCEAGWWLGAAARNGVLTGGRVDGDAG
jgi:hypothetical protein